MRVRRTDAEPRGGTTRSSDEVPEKGWSKGVVLWSQIQCANQKWEEPNERSKAVCHFEEGGLGGV